MRGVLEAFFVLKPPSLEAPARDLVSKQTPSLGRQALRFVCFFRRGTSSSRSPSSRTGQCAGSSPFWPRSNLRLSR